MPQNNGAGPYLCTDIKWVKVKCSEVICDHSEALGGIYKMTLFSGSELFRCLKTDPTQLKLYSTSACKCENVERYRSNLVLQSSRPENSTRDGRKHLQVPLAKQESKENHRNINKPMNLLNESGEINITWRRASNGTVMCGWCGCRAPYVVGLRCSGLLD